MSKLGMGFIYFDRTAFPAALAFVSAYVEVACFIGLFGLFTSFVTGDIILIGVELVQETPQIVTKILVLPLFILSCVLWSWMLRRAPHPSAPVIRKALLSQALLLVIALALAAYLAPLDKTNPLPILAVAVPAVLACSLQMIMMRHQITIHPHTTIMTGNIGQTALAIASFYTSHPHDDQEPAAPVTGQKRPSIRHQLSIILGFLFGAVCGGLAFAAIGFSCLFLPALMLVTCACFGSIGTDASPNRQQGTNAS